MEILERQDISPENQFIFDDFERHHKELKERKLVKPGCILFHPVIKVDPIYSIDGTDSEFLLCTSFGAFRGIAENQKIRVLRVKASKKINKISTEDLLTNMRNGIIFIDKPHIPSLAYTNDFVPIFYKELTYKFISGIQVDKNFREFITHIIQSAFDNDEYLEIFKERHYHMTDLNEINYEKYYTEPTLNRALMLMSLELMQINIADIKKLLKTTDDYALFYYFLLQNKGSLDTIQEVNEWPLKRRIELAKKTVELFDFLFDYSKVALDFYKFNNDNIFIDFNFIRDSICLKKKKFIKYVEPDERFKKYINQMSEHMPLPRDLVILILKFSLDVFAISY